MPPGIADLPFQAAASQIFGDTPLPNVAPKIFLAFGPLTRLNASGHLLKLIPSFRRLRIAVLSQKIRTIIQNTDIGVMRYSHQFVAHGVARDHDGILRGELSREIR